ncbi:MAG TPA: hypothetical protein ACFYEK_17230 [Candidatus Wunengus sp. YC60]|uniref:hypothetical protein n=1 Tax=Candidatus Wunengus sp. YC60 TaxID=3367697 RepID=UPI004025CB7C
MEKSIDLTQMQKLVEEAEQVASIVKDSQLKPVAFEIILGFLLHNRKTSFTGTCKVPKSDQSKEEIKNKKNEGTMTWLEELKEENFFEEPKNSSKILSALAERGHHLKDSDLTLPLQKLTKRKLLRRKKQAPIEGKREVWYYSNW